MLDRLMDGEPIELLVRGDEGDGSERTRRARPRRRERHALTEPGALMPGLGFDFWYPTIPTEIGKIVPGSPAAQADLRIGDVIVAVDDKPVADFPALVKIVQPSPGKTLRVRRRARATIGSACRSKSRHMREGGRLIGRIGIQPVAGVADPRRHAGARALWSACDSAGRAIDKTWNMSVLTVRMIWNVATGDVSVKNLSGPINIAEYAGFSARQGILSFLSFLAVVSVSLFVLNLLPIPILDGGQIVYQVAELVKGSPLSERAQAVGQQIGIVLLLMLMSFAFYNDLSRLFS